MTIAVISTSRWPSELADSRLLVKMADSFSKLNHHVSYLIPLRLQTNSHLKIKSPWKFYDIKPHSFAIKKLFCLDFLKLYPLKLWQPLLTYSFITAALRCLLAHRPQLIYAYQKEFALLKLALPHSKFVLEFHDRPSDPYQRLIFMFSKKFVDLWVTPTPSLARFLQTHNIHSANIATLPSGVDLGQFNKLTKTQARRQLNLPLKSKIIGYIGRLQGKDGSRGIDVVLKALKHLTQTRADFIFVSVGGPQSAINHYQQKAKRLSLAGQTRFIDHVDHSDVPIYLAAFDVCLLPFPDTPHYKNHMAPMKLFEYLLANRPIVATDLPSLKAYLSDSQTVFVKPGSSQSLALGITHALKLPAKPNPSTQTLKPSSLLTWTSRAQYIIGKLNP